MGLGWAKKGHTEIVDNFFAAPEKICNDVHVEEFCQGS